jgi:SEC-C motif-containing protein
MDIRTRACPCGSTSYDGCCGRLHRGEAQAGSPEELMRSRFSAYAVGDRDYVWRTWHPRTRPAEVTLDRRTHWTTLEVIEAVDDLVEFRAHFSGPGGTGVLHERSSFAHRAGRWFYLTGEAVSDH